MAVHTAGGKRHTHDSYGTQKTVAMQNGLCTQGQSLRARLHGTKDMYPWLSSQLKHWAIILCWDDQEQSL